MDDDHLATVIPFPRRVVRGRVPQPDHEPDRLQEYWAFVQRLAAERRDLALRPDAGGDTAAAGAARPVRRRS